MKLKNTTISLIVFLFCITLFAQDDPGWVWAERGGSSAQIGGSQRFDYGMERIVDLAIDSHNNYYYLAEVGGYTFTLDEMEFDTYNDHSSEKEIFVFSTDSGGNYRWSKIIGGGGE